jgi:membrane protein implicated in regulation of membrane protease activity
MGIAVIVFLAVGVLGLALLGVAMLGGEIFDDSSSIVSVEIIAAVLSGFGFSAAFAAALPGVDLPAAICIIIGVLGAVPVAYFAWLLTSRARKMRTDATPNRTDLVGRKGVVVTEIRDGVYGEVRVRIGGQQVKLNALADGPVATGVHIVVTEAPSDTSVRVTPLSQEPL